MFNLTINGDTLEAINLTSEEYKTLQDIKGRVDRYQQENPDWAVNNELKDYLNARANEETHRINELNKIRQSFK
ncbi:MAG: hypothetical protein LKE41_05915 [Prevotella sp.]|jgi:hypothetical protein|nr:hypothetical protein [Prevotella sp.]MCI2080303.1 hypothetical protein [Prevotella sp.]MCI2101622.1 hypothetical protein [Prevotella sp.]